MHDRHFDQLASRFAEKIYGGAKGAIRLAVLQADLKEVLPQRPLRVLDIGAGLGQPQAHVAEAAANVEDPQRALRQRFLEVGLEYGQTDGALGAAVDFLGEAGGQLVEVAITHAEASGAMKRRSLSASLARTTCSRFRPSSLQSSRR